MFSDSTTGSCFGQSEGLTRLTSYFTHHNIVERPRIHSNNGTGQSKKWGSGKYPYKKLIAENLEPTLMAALDRGPVLLICYSFSCRAVSLMFSRPNTNMQICIVQERGGACTNYPYWIFFWSTSALSLMGGVMILLMQHQMYFCLLHLVV